MKLGDLLEGLGVVNWREADASTLVRGVTANSREVLPGFIFVAIKGARFDGHSALGEVAGHMPAAIVVEDPKFIPKNYEGAHCVVKNTRQALDSLASRFAGRPSERLFCVGVTGTNGKTTLTHMIEWVFNQNSKAMAVMGTIDHHLGEKKWPTSMTTPPPVELQARLAEFLNHGAQAVALEVSSHAIEQARADSVNFDVAVFTNLTRDHLDYHHDMESYFQAKQRLFVELLPRSSKNKKWAVINIDDEWGRKIRPPAGITSWSYGKKASDFRYRLLHTGFEGLMAEIETFEGSKRLALPMVGEYNLANGVAALAVASAAGLPMDSVLKALGEFPGVPGRLQRVGEEKPYVFVDYAHTPDALENVLLSLIEVRKKSGAGSRIHCIFGCGGDRDTGKRPLMAAIASRLADEVWITSDNPRTEAPEQIIEDILAGLETRGDKVHVIEDRKLAITKCISQAECGEVVLIAGKGHEDYQIVGDTKIPFSDFEVARKALDEKTV